MSGIIPNKDTCVIRCDYIEDLELQEIISAMPKGFHSIVGTKQAVVDYMSKMNTVQTGTNNLDIFRPIPDIKLWYINYSHTHEEYIQVLSDFKKYVNIEHFYYQAMIDNNEFLVFIGSKNISVIYSNGIVKSLQDENEKLKTDLNSIPKWIRSFFIRKK